jgi:toxin ParE1/3/4
VKGYVVSPDARVDLEGIWDYIAERSSVEIATKFLQKKFYDTFASVASSPSAGVAVADFPVEGTRKFPMGNYLIYYQSKRGKVRISRVLHGKRLQRRAWFQKP